MKDRPGKPRPQPGTLQEPEPVRKSPAILRYGEPDWYISHIAVFTTAGAITWSSFT